ncbi:MAG: hypothetical protein AAGD11_08725 [Planctomycetota bacterium]
MSRSNQQLARLIQELIRGVKSGRIKVRWIVAIGAVAVGYLLLQPVLHRSLGIDLPGLDDLQANPSASDESGRKIDSSNSPTTSRRTHTSLPDRSELVAILAGSSNRTFTSPGGLRYTRGSVQGHRVKHLMAHTRDLPDRPGQHGVFDSDDPAKVVALVDEAYLQAQAGRDTRTQREAERTVYDVNMRRRIGYIGGQSGNRRNKPAAKHLRLVVEGDRLITAFPVIP